MVLWPSPRRFEHGSTPLWLSSEVEFIHRYKKVVVVGGGCDENAWYKEGLELRAETAGQPFSSVSAAVEYPPDLLQVAFERFKSRVFEDRFVPYKFYPRDVQFEPCWDNKAIYIKQITIEESSIESQEDRHSAISREAYSIEISADGTTIIGILSPAGGVRALDTLAQLFYALSTSAEDVYMPYAPLSVKDAPAFEHRGLNLDISRNWILPQDVLRTVRAMGFNKLNRLHLHATDAQSWPMEIPALPDLARKGAYREDLIWTTHDLEEVQRHGLYHGVEVYLEIDLPGHTASIFHSYPDLITAYNKPWKIYAKEPPSGQLKLNSPDVPPFLTTLFNDLLPRSARFSSHFHIGGDEVNREAYNLDPTVRSSSKEVLKPLLQKFMDHVISLTESHALTPIFWEEMLLEWDLKLPASAIVQTWRSGSSLAKVVAKGHQALFGPSEEWYLDCGFGTFIDPDPANPARPIKYPYQDWCPPYKNWRQVLSFDPLADIPPEQQHLVIGGEVHLWGELTDSVNLDNMLWPRVAAAAGVMWRGKGEVGEESTRHLAEMRERLVVSGVRAGMVQMEWGLRNKNSCIL